MDSRSSLRISTPGKSHSDCTFSRSSKFWDSLFHKLVRKCMGGLFKVGWSATVSCSDLLENDTKCVYIDKVTLHAKFQFFPKSRFWVTAFYVIQNSHWLTVCKVFGTQPNSPFLLFFWKHDWFINHLLRALYHLDENSFCFVCYTKIKYLICFCTDRIIIWSTWNGNVGTFWHFLYFF